MGTPSVRRFIYGSQSTPLAIVHDFVRECDRAIARSEKDQALFYWYPDKDDIDNSSTTGWHLGSARITFFDVDSIDVYFYGNNLSHGLRIITTARWRSYDSIGEFYHGNDGDGRGATLEAVS